MDNIQTPNISIPYEIADAFNAVDQELLSHGFAQSEYDANKPSLLSYTKDNEIVLLEIKNDDITIRHYIIIDDKRKLKTLYVQKNSKRTFNLKG